MSAYLAVVPPELFLVFAFAFGAILGSFVNAAVYRLPRNISLLTRTRSFCPKCSAQIAGYDNIPILSFLLLRGKCRKCKQPIPWRYLQVELIVACLFALSAYQFFLLNRLPAPPPLSSMPAILMAVQMFLIADLICVTFTDLETWFIPIGTTWPWILAGLILAPLFPELHLSMTRWTSSARLDALIDSFQGLVLGAGALWVVGFVCVVVLGKEGMGIGDVHLVGMLGAILGWKPALATILIACFIGATLGISLILWGKIQRARLGERYQPRRPTFEVSENEADQGPPPDWPLLVMGGIVLAFEAPLFCSAIYSGGVLLDPRLINVCAGLMVGGFLLLAYPVRRRMVASGRWPQGEIRQREDGKKEEVLEGNYLPFGPSLALAGLIVIFYDPLIRLWIWWYLIGRHDVPAAMVARGVTEVPWNVYQSLHPLLFQVPGG